MKANEAPEKIYLVRTTRIIDEWRRKPSQYAHNIQYTRTDAFIEKACEYLKNYRRDVDGIGYIPGIVDDKTIDDFKNYMKGE